MGGRTIDDHLLAGLRLALRRRGDPGDAGRLLRGSRSRCARSIFPACSRSSSSSSPASSSAWCWRCRATTCCSATARPNRSACWSRCRSSASSGPWSPGCLFASRAGSAITAEIGLMKATEQLSAMEMMAVDPLARVVAPRFWGGIISMPLLAALFSTLGVFGAYLVGVKLIGIDAGAFWGNMQAGVDFRYDIVNGVIKSIVFGVAVSMIAVFEGYDAKPTAEGVSTATTRTVVESSLAILGLDFVLTVFMFRGVALLKDPYEAVNLNRCSTRSLGRRLRRARHRRDPLSRAQGRQSHRFRVRAGLPARGALRQHRRPEAPRLGEGGRRRRRPRRVHQARSRHLPGGRHAQDRPGIPVHGGHDRVDPDVRSPGRRLHRARPGRRHQDARRRRQGDQDAVGDRPREADRAVPVRQGRDREARSEAMWERSESGDSRPGAAPVRAMRGAGRRRSSPAARWARRAKTRSSPRIA